MNKNRKYISHILASFTLFSLKSGPGFSWSRTTGFSRRWARWQGAPTPRWPRRACGRWAWTLTGTGSSCCTCWRSTATTRCWCQSSCAAAEGTATTTTTTRVRLPAFHLLFKEGWAPRAALLGRSEPWPFVLYSLSPRVSAPDTWQRAAIRWFVRPDELTLRVDQ